MYIQNITFIVSPENVPAMIEKISSDIVPELMKNLSDENAPRLAEVIMPETYSAPEAPRSISLQFEFEEGLRLQKWQKESLYPVLESLQKEMGEEGLTFPTVLKTIPL